LKIKTVDKRTHTAKMEIIIILGKKGIAKATIKKIFEYPNIEYIPIFYSPFVY